MLLESVEVRSFRTIQSLTIALTRGLNVIHGDNDVGKSTLMDAIRACLTGGLIKVLITDKFTAERLL